MFNSLESSDLVAVVAILASVTISIINLVWGPKVQARLNREQYLRDTRRLVYQDAMVYMRLLVNHAAARENGEDESALAFISEEDSESLQARMGLLAPKSTSEHFKAVQRRYRERFPGHESADQVGLNGPTATEPLSKTLAVLGATARTAMKQDLDIADD